MNKRAFAWTDGRFLAEIEAKYRAENLLREWIIEKPAIRYALSAIGDKLPQQRYSPVGVLGVGGSGIVLEVQDSLFPTVNNALKFPRPVQGKVDLLADMLAKEVSFLADLRHPGIVRMLYYRKLENVQNYGDLPFYLMEAVNGEPSGKFVSAPSTDLSTFLAIVRQTAQVIAYLHTHPGIAFAHLDIKPENIIVSSDGRPIIIDLGTCKRLVGDETRTIVACTRSIAHPGLLRRLEKDPSDNNRARGSLARAEIEPVWDLWAFGRTILLWLGVRFDDGGVESHALIERLDPYTRKYLVLLCARLLTDGLPTWLLKRVGLAENFLKSIPIRDSIDLCDQIDRLIGFTSPLDQVPEIAEATTGTIQAAPGVHVPNTERLTLTLNHRLFRRLASITQLGVVSQIFPSAKHTRREHSLGTYGNIGRVVRALYNDPVSPLFRQIITATDITEILLVSLLHDIGQFPLAHELEEVDRSMFDHDRLTESMLRGSWKIGRRGSKEITFESLKQVFDSWGTSAERLIGILSAKATSTSASPKAKLLRSLISGPIDADKLDYLFRDARHTDVPYPNGVDIDRLFRCLTTVVFDKVESAENVPAIGVHAKGKVAAEFLTMARYAMFSQVYWHHAVRAHKAMLSRAVCALIAAQSSETKLEELRAQFTDMVCNLPESLYVSDLPLFRTDATEPSTSNPFGVGTDLAPTDAAVLIWLRRRLEESKRPEFRLIDGILSRQLYKRLWIIGRDSVQEKRWDRALKLWEQLTRSNRDRASRDFEKAIADKLTKGKVQSITSMSASDATALIEQLTRAQEPWLLIDVPGGRAGSDVGLSYVMENQARRLRKDDRSVGDLQASAVWDQYARDLRNVAGKLRIFCDHRLVETMDVSLTLDHGFDELYGVLEKLSV